MKTTTKTPLRSNRGTITVAADKWHAIDAALQTLRTEFIPIAQPLTEAERRSLLRVQMANEAFARDYLALVEAHPEVVPATMHTEDTLRDWQTREELRARHQAIMDLARQLEDTRIRLESDCYAAALAGYQIVRRGAAPTGADESIAGLREHWSRRQERRNQTLAAKRALEAAQSAASGHTPAPAPAPAEATALVVPMSGSADSAAAPRKGSMPAALAA